MCFLFFKASWTMKYLKIVVRDPAFFVVTDIFSSTMKIFWSILTLFHKLDLFPFLDAIPVYLDTYIVLDILDNIPLEIISDRLLDLFRYFGLDTVPSPSSQTCYVFAGCRKLDGEC